MNRFQPNFAVEVFYYAVLIYDIQKTEMQKKFVCDVITSVLYTIQLCCQDLACMCHQCSLKLGTLSKDRLGKGTLFPTHCPLPVHVVMCNEITLQCCKLVAAIAEYNP